jgi:hypothetical protein
VFVGESKNGEIYLDGDLRFWKATRSTNISHYLPTIAGINESSFFGSVLILSKDAFSNSASLYTTMAKQGPRPGEIPKHVIPLPPPPSDCGSGIMSDGSITASVLMMMMPEDGSVQLDEMYDSMMDVERQDSAHLRQLQQQLSLQRPQVKEQPADSTFSHVTLSPTCPSTKTSPRPPSVLKPNRYTKSLTKVASTSIHAIPSIATAATASEEESVPSPTKKRVTLMISPEEEPYHHHHDHHHPSIVSASKQRGGSQRISRNNNNNNSNRNHATKRKKACWCQSTVLYSLFGVAITMTIVAVGINVLLYFDRQQNNAAAAASEAASTTTTTSSPASSPNDFPQTPSTTSGQENDPWLEIFPPSTSPNVAAPSQLSDDDIAAMITDIVTNQFRVEFNNNDDPMTPVNRAVQWLIEEAQEYHNQNATQVYHTLEKFSQRFAVLVLYYALTTATTVSSSSSSTLSSSSAGTSVVNTTMDDIPQRGLDECEWMGVNCTNKEDDEDEMISQIDFSDWDLSGTIPSEIKFLPKLVHLDLSNNRLQGTLPDELYGLTRMERVYLYQNQLSGTLSPSISQWESLQVLHVSNNRLKGPIPQELQQLDDEGFRPLRKFGHEVPKKYIGIGFLGAFSFVACDFIFISSL